MKLNYYGPINRQGVIKKVIANTYSTENLTDKQSSITIQPDPGRP